MRSVLVDLIPIMVGAAIVPGWVIIVLLLLHGEDGLAKAVAFVGGVTGGRLLQGALSGFVVRGVAAGGDDKGATIVSTLLAVAGLLMLITAAKQFRKEDDPDAPPPKWMTIVGSLTPLKALGLGALMITLAGKQWIFTLSAVGVIGKADLGPISAVTAFLGYVLGAQLPVVVPLVASSVAPTQAAVTLAATTRWMERHNRQILIAVSVLFGVYFLFRGVSGLIG